MLSFYNIWTIAKFEIKTLSRSWFLRIFAGPSFVILILYDTLVFTDAFGGFIPRDLYGLPASIPYINMVFFNLAQAVITIFLASDFLKRDKKLDTTEAIYIRSMTNSDYILGKTLGLVVIFFFLNLVVLLISAGFNVLVPDNNFNFITYILYPAIVSLPTVIFIVGLSFFMMILIKNQAITFILLLGYIALTLFYLGGKYYQVFDYTGFYMPFAYSDFIGFGNTLDLVLLRGAYVLAGLSFVFFTMSFFKRLPQGGILERTSLIIAVILLLGGISSGYFYIQNLNAGSELRVGMIEANNKYSAPAGLAIIKDDLEIHHSENEISGTADMVLRNGGNSIADFIIINLNPGLKISAITSSNQPVEFTRDFHIVKIMPLQPILPGTEFQMKIEYNGIVDSRAAYLDISDDQRNGIYEVALLKSAKKYAIVDANAVVLTPENMWYPAIGTTFRPEAPFSNSKHFTEFKLKVNTKPELTVISQGARNNEGDGKFSFTPDYPMNNISLTIGAYKERSIEVDSIQYNLYTLPDHNYFERYFTELGDTLVPLIRELRQDYERKINFSYPYKRFSLVEVPVQFYTYKRLWTNRHEKSQPEIVFLTENGVLLSAADFKQRERMTERFGNRGNQVILPTEQQSGYLTSFVKGTFFDEQSGFRFRFGGNFSDEIDNPYSIFPNFYNFVNSIESDKFKVFNIALENYLKVTDDLSGMPFVRNILGLTSAETAVQKLSEKSLAEIIKDTTYNSFLPSILKLKGQYLFASISNRIGEDNLKKLISESLKKSEFKKIKLSDLSTELKTKFNIDLISELNQWLKGDKLPGYYFTNIAGYKIIDNDKERFQVKLNITNPEPVDGLVELTFDPRRGGPGGFGPRGGGQDETIDKRTIFIPASATVKFAAVLDEEPGRVTINTLVSQNLPLEQEISFNDFELNKKAQGIDELSISKDFTPFSIKDEYVVDNEDTSFVFHKAEQKSWLKRILDIGSDDTTKYIGIRWWRPPSDWRATINSDAYGKFIHSAYFTRAQDGNSSVEWNVNLPANGYYDVYTNIIKPRMGFRRRNEKDETAYHYTIYHDDGKEEVTVELQNADEGWSLLGSFYFSEGSAKVELSNESPSGIIMADAVKWLFRK